MKPLTVRQLIEALTPFLESAGDLELSVRQRVDGDYHHTYFSGVTVTFQPNEKGLAPSDIVLEAES